MPIQAPTVVFPPNKSAGLSARLCVTSQVCEEFLWAIFLPRQCIVSMFFSGVGRQPISASPVLFLANEVWITWLKCCRLCEHEEHRPTNTRNCFSALKAVPSLVRTSRHGNLSISLISLRVLRAMIARFLDISRRDTIGELLPSCITEDAMATGFEPCPLTILMQTTPTTISAVY